MITKSVQWTQLTLDLMSATTTKCGATEMSTAHNAVPTFAAMMLGKI